jgi:hypothetical protein
MRLSTVLKNAVTAEIKCKHRDYDEQVKGILEISFASLFNKLKRLKLGVTFATYFPLASVMFVNALYDATGF